MIMRGELKRNMLSFKIFNNIKDTAEFPILIYVRLITIGSKNSGSEVQQNEMFQIVFTFSFLQRKI